MSHGHADSVRFLNEQHEAVLSGISAMAVEAYGPNYDVSVCAASSCGETFACEPMNASVCAWMHPITVEADFQSPYRAILDAQINRFEILFEVDSPIDLLKGDRWNIYAHAQPEAQEKNVEVRSCLKRPHVLAIPNKHPKFLSEITLCMGSDSELSMTSSTIHHQVLVNWIDKPWQLWQYNKHGDWARCAPPSEEAVLSSALIRQPICLDNLLTDHRLPFATCRITDFHGQVEGMDRIRTDRINPPDNPDPIAQPITIPAFMRHLFDVAVTDGELTDDEELIFHVRTWLIHHVNHPRCENPRVVELDSEWQRWHQEILSSWRDHVQPDQLHNLHVVAPEPHRHPRYQHCIADLIIVVGEEDQRFAGLVTVSSLEVGDDPTFSVAASFPHDVSGMMIRAAADANQICEQRRCNVYHGWHEIPQNFEHTHRMSQGDALAIYLSPRNMGGHVGMPSDAMDDSANQGTELDFNDHSNEYAHPEEHEPPHHHDASSNQESNESSREADVVYTRSLPESLQIVRLYRLHRPTVQARVRWGSYDNLLLDVARALNVAVAQITSLHHVRVVPVGENEHEASVIVQMINDIPDGSSDKLVLLDVESHQPTDAAQYPITPDITRNVMRVVIHMVRAHVLMLGNVVHICQGVHDRCLVRHDHVLWPVQDLAVRTFAHGHYLRISVPPLDNNDGSASGTLNLHAPADVRQHVPESTPSAPEETPDESTPDPQPSKRVRKCKGNEHVEVIDIPMMLPPNVPMRRPRPAHDGNFEWVDDIAGLFAEHGFHERISGVTFLQVQSWFVHHGRHRTCLHPRRVQLEEQVITWTEDFRHAWRDMLDPGTPFSIRVVKPRPPQFRSSGFACHVLLEQGRPPAMANAGILTGLIAGERHNGITQGAFAVSQPLTFAEAEAKLRLSQHGDPTVRSFRHGSAPLSLTEPVWLPEGFSATIHSGREVRETNEWSIQRITEQFDDLVLMQRPGSPQSTTHGNAAAGHDGECNRFSLNILAAEFQPGRPHIGLQTEFVQDLFASWSQHVFAWEGEQATAPIVTWMVDHRLPFPTCTASREVQLDDNFQDWEQQIRSRWRDLLDFRLPHELHLVIPHPPNMEQGVAAHVILIQAPREDWVSNLVTIEDWAFHNGHMRRLVITTQEHIMAEHVAQACGYGVDCIHGRGLFRCQVWIQNFQIMPMRPWPGRSGTSIHLHVRSQAAQNAPDAANFLQTRVERRRSGPAGYQNLWKQVQTKPTEYMPDQTHTGPILSPVLEDAPGMTHAQGSAIRVIAPPHVEVPTFFEVPNQPDASQVYAELLTWCPHMQSQAWHWIDDLKVVICLEEWPNPMTFHSIYVDEADQPFHYTFHDVASQKRTDIEHLRWLYQQGFQRAVMTIHKQMSVSSCFVTNSRSCPRKKSDKEPPGLRDLNIFLRYNLFTQRFPNGLAIHHSVPGPLVSLRRTFSNSSSQLPTSSADPLTAWNCPSMSEKLWPCVNLWAELTGLSCTLMAVPNQSTEEGHLCKWKEKDTVTHGHLLPLESNSKMTKNLRSMSSAGRRNPSCMQKMLHTTLVLAPLDQKLLRERHCFGVGHGA